MMAWLIGMGGVTLVILSFFLVADQGATEYWFSRFFVEIYYLFVIPVFAAIDLFSYRYGISWWWTKAISISATLIVSLLIFSGIGYLAAPWLTHRRQRSLVRDKTLEFPRFILLPKAQAGLVFGTFAGMLAMLGLAYAGGGHEWGSRLLYYGFQPVMVFFNGFILGPSAHYLSSVSGSLTLFFVVSIVYVGGFLEGWVVGYLFGWIKEKFRK
jgi:hypothetical protein